MFHLDGAPPARPRGSLLIRTMTAGVNFKDVMNSLHLLSDESTHGGIAEHRLGVEWAGLVKESGNPDFPVGYRVMGIGQHGFSGLTYLDDAMALHVPPSWSWEASGDFPRRLFDRVGWVGAIGSHAAHGSRVDPQRGRGGRSRGHPSM